MTAIGARRDSARMPFRNLEVQKLPVGKVVPLVVAQLRHPKHGEPVLHVMYLGETNVDYWNDAIARANTKASTQAGRKAITAADIRDARKKNRETVAQYSVKGLENVWHDDGRAASLDDIQDVVNALPDEVFDTVLAFVTNPENFRDRVIDGDVDETAAK